MCIRDSSQFDADGKGHYERLARPNIDTGMGLERLACVMQNVGNLFEVDTVPVSYTHLDVYKRQSRVTAESRNWLTVLPRRNIYSRMPKLMVWLRAVATVSYTHLDVYKRQLLRDIAGGISQNCDLAHNFPHFHS